MNRFLTYILPFIGLLMFSCSQQNEASYVEESDAVESLEDEKTFYDDELNTYEWVSTDVEQQVAVLSDIEKDKNQLEEVDELGNDDVAGGVSTGNESTPESANKDQSAIAALTKEKVLKAFVKTNIEDVLDLLSLYAKSNKDAEMGEIAQLAIDEYLKEMSFQDFVKVILNGFEGNKKLKLSDINLDDKGVYNGSVSIKNATKTVSIDYQIISTVTDYGVSRKFRIVGVQ